MRREWLESANGGSVVRFVKQKRKNRKYKRGQDVAVEAGGKLIEGTVTYQRNNRLVVQCGTVRVSVPNKMVTSLA